MKALLIILICVSCVFAWSPSQPKSVVINTSSLRHFDETIESTSACTVDMEITTTYTGVAPIYLHIASRTSTRSPGYTLSLLDEDTGVYKFQNVRTSSGTISALRVKCGVDLSHRYRLSISCPPSQRIRAWYGALLYRPVVTVYYGLCGRGTQFDVEF